MDSKITKEVWLLDVDHCKGPLYRFSILFFKTESIHMLKEIAAHSCTSAKNGKKCCSRRFTNDWQQWNNLTMSDLPFLWQLKFKFELHQSKQGSTPWSDNILLPRTLYHRIKNYTVWITSFLPVKCYLSPPPLNCN